MSWDAMIAAERRELIDRARRRARLLQLTEDRELLSALADALEATEADAARIRAAVGDGLLDLPAGGAIPAKPPAGRP